MTPEQIALVSAIGEVVAAVGTVGALFAAIATLRYESSERHRSEIRGVRTSLDWIEPVWVTARRDQDPDFDLRSYLKAEAEKAEATGQRAYRTVETVKPVGKLENGSDETIYDVRVALRPVKFFQMHMSGITDRLTPGQTYDLPPGLEIESRIAYWDPEKLRPGVEAVFTDGRGARWNRTTLGRLRILKPLKWYAPWRVSHELDRGDLPWWAWRAKWHYRWEDHTYRDRERYPPVWWAVDIRWKRWRWAQRHDPISIPWWKVRERFRNRRTICASRFAQRLPFPWWAVDERWKNWRWYRESVAADREDLANYEASLAEAATSGSG